MSKLVFCWRCAAEMPMLEEHEWAELYPLLQGAIGKRQEYRQKHGVSLTQALEQGFGREALEKFKELTGFEAINPDALCHHRLSLLGAPCESCGKFLRTPTAKKCFECGAVRSNKTIEPMR